MKKVISLILTLIMILALAVTAAAATDDTYQIDVHLLCRNVKTGETYGLEGGGFKLENADGLYYTNTDGVVSWTDTGTEYITESPDFTVSFVGVANGTYTLEQTAGSPGYNWAWDQEVTVNNANLTGDRQVEVENTVGEELPDIGGPFGMWLTRNLIILAVLAFPVILFIKS